MTGCFLFVLVFVRGWRAGHSHEGTMEDVAVVSAGGNTEGAVSAPATFADAFQPAPAASPAAEPAIASDTPPAAAQPGSPSTETPQQVDERSPFIPRPRFDEVNTERNTLKAWKQQHAWAENPDVREVLDRIARSKGDPMAFFAEQFQELASHPVHSQSLRSFLGQQFDALRQRQQAPPEVPQAPEPDVAITDAQGQVVGRTYSHEALAQRDAVFKQQILQEVAHAFAPRLQTLDTLTQERAQQAADAKAESFATAFAQELGALPGFDLKAHGPAIAAELRQLQLAPDAHPSEVNAAAYRAYVKVVLPTLGAKAQSQLLDSLQTKAAASTAITPSSAAPTSRSKVTSFLDPNLTW